MRAIISRVGRWLDISYMTVSLFLLGVVIVASSLQIFTRYVMGSAVTGTEELGRYCFIWMSMLGGSICAGKWLHPSISIITDMLTPKMRKASDVFLNILIVVVSIVLVDKGTDMVMLTTKQLSSVLRIPMSIVYLSVPLGSFGMGWHAVENILKAISHDTDSVKREAAL